MLENNEVALFSELMEHNAKVMSAFSPKSQRIASAFQSQLHIWDVNSKEISQKYECDNLIDLIKWSPDSKLVCCGSLKESIQVWNLDMANWRCKISGCLPFINILWAPNSQNLLVVSEFYIKITIFSLASSAIAEIDNLKAIENGIIYSPCKKFLVVAHRVNFEDYLGVYCCDTWEVIKTFPVDTKDLTSIYFAPSDLIIAVLDSAILEYKVLFYSIDGRLLGKHMTDSYFGLISLSWSLTKNLVAVGDCFNEVKILDCSDFEVLSSYQHPDAVESTDVTFYKVTENSDVRNSPGDTCPFFLELDEVVKSRPLTIVPSTPDNEKGKTKNLLKSGVQILQFSADGKYIASVNANTPKAVFIYDVENVRLYDVVMRGSSIKSICWHPEKPYLIIISSPNVFDVWTHEKCIRYLSDFKDDFPIIHAAWSSTGEYVLLNSRDHFSVVYFP